MISVRLSSRTGCSMATGTLDILLAHKALNLAQGLGENDRRVAAVLLDHFNRRTRRCDPAVESIARLLGINRRTVIRAIDRLVAAGLFRKHRHGGGLGRNAYEPDFERFQELGKAWDARRGVVRRYRTGVSPGRCQSGHLGGDSGVTQTYRRNLQEETYVKKRPSEGRTTSPSARVSLPSVQASSSRTEIARNAAERRWTDALAARFRSDTEAYARAIEAIDEPIRNEATETELRRPGSGLPLLLDRLSFATATASIPPSSADAADVAFASEPNPEG
jgi:predicted transcriptional regulator